MKTVDLTKSYTGHQGPFSKVELREPTYKDVFIDGLGVPYQWMPVAGSGFVRMLLPEVIDQYVTRLAVNPTGESLTVLGAIDAMRLADAVCDFFMEPKTPETPPTGSSSASDSMQPASPA